MKKTIVFVLLMTSINSIACKKIDSVQVTANCQSINYLWVDEYLDLTKNCVGFSAPVAARAINYISIGTYESLIEYTSTQKSLSGQLAGYTRETWITDEEISFPISVNEVNYRLTLFFYNNMPPANREKVQMLYSSLLKEYSRKTSKKTTDASKVYANKIANEIISWSKLDGGFEGYKRNFPKDYVIVKCDSCWVKTPISYQSALLPNWGGNQLLIPSNGLICDDIPTLLFSTEHGSSFYQENERINELYLNLSEEKEIIAEYWDDSPGFSGSPVGHFFKIAKDLAIREGISLEESCELFMLIGIAINDAVIESWRLKYTYNLIRPITYIKQYINPLFDPTINTPPFPEFPSGHSFQSGAGSEILKKYFSDSLAFTDYTNQNRTDINGSPRSYINVSEMSEEMSMSRFYGGIHYLRTLEVSLTYGRKIGRNTLDQITTR